MATEQLHGMVNVLAARSYKYNIYEQKFEILMKIRFSVVAIVSDIVITDSVFTGVVRQEAVNYNSCLISQC